MQNEFMGYERDNGTVGIRNKIAIVPSVICAQHVANRIAQKVDGAVALVNVGGCGQLGLDFQFTANVLAGCAANPNVYGAVVVGLGCENMTSDIIRKRIEQSRKRVESFDIQDVRGGSPGAIEKGIEIAKKMQSEASELKKEPFDFSHLVLGLECGSSDAFSGISSNPATGIVSDRIVRLGGTSILPEFTEWVGTEHLLAKRAVNDAVGRLIKDAIHAFLDEMERQGTDFRLTQPTLGNRKGGLSTIEEKSLGTIAKAGKLPIQGMILYGGKPKGKGLWLLLEPGLDIESMTGLAAAGAQVIIFTTGRGSPAGNVISPTIKVTGNPNTSEYMGINLDVDASGVVTGKQSIDELGELIWDKLVKTCNGELTQAEKLGHEEMAIWRVPPVPGKIFEKFADLI
ncbi:MAG: UxaA family hydrolase [Candidatus Sigynarchaeota archaeon]